MMVGGDGEVTSAPKPEELFHLLRTDRLTLLFARLKDAAAMHQSVQSLLPPWKSLLEVHHVAPAAGQEEPFRKVFGTQPSMILVRSDGYAAFTGPEHGVEALVKYLDTWFPAPQQTQEESAHA
jgi:hypothetical protein